MVLAMTELGTRGVLQFVVLGLATWVTMELLLNPRARRWVRWRFVERPRFDARMPRGEWLRRMEQWRQRQPEIHP